MTITSRWSASSTDPVYLTEPFIRSTDFVLDLHQQIDPTPASLSKK